MDLRARVRTRLYAEATGASKEQLEAIYMAAYEAAIHRLNGEIQKALKLEQKVDVMVRKAEREGWGDEASAVEMGAQEDAQSG